MSNLSNLYSETYDSDYNYVDEEEEFVNEVEVINNQDIVVWNRGNSGKQKHGRPVDPVWDLFTEELDAHKLSAGPKSECKHCCKLVMHHNKTAQVKRHLMKCPNFKTLMDFTDVQDRPEWYAAKKAKENQDKSVQHSIRKYALPKLTKHQLTSIHNSVAMFFYATNTPFVRVEDPNLLKAFQLCNPSATLPNRQKLGGELLQSCYNKVKSEMD